MAESPQPSRSHWTGLWLVRYGVPIAMTIAGGVLIALGHASTKSAAAALGLVLCGLALTVWMMNWLYRLSLESNEDRQREEDARDYFSQHGRWPDEP